MRYPLFLLAVTGVLVSLALTNLQGNPLQRFALPVAAGLLMLQTLRTMPPWRWRLGAVPLQRIYVLMGWFGALSVWTPYLLGYNVSTPWRVLLSLNRSLFLLLTAVRLVEVLARSRHVSGNTLCLGIAGYIHLGLTCGQLATLLQLLDGDSFRLGAISSGEELITRLSYFSFITIGTLGYGDVVPATGVGESFVILISIISTLYINLLIGLLLSRYISGRSRQGRPLGQRPAALGPPRQRSGSAIQGREQRFPWFLAATLLPILLLPFSDLNGTPLQRLLMPLAATLLILQAIEIMPADPQGMALLGNRRLYRGLGRIILVLVWLPSLLGAPGPRLLVLPILTAISLFYALTSVRILQLLARVEGVNWRTLTLAAAGYVQLGLTGGQIATLLALAQTDSFQMGALRGGEQLLHRLNYYAFVTLGSIGYGDIVPTRPLTELLSVALSLGGTLYISLILGIVLSRYINDQAEMLFGD